jgi:predicted secreted Zn-dependent protease
MGRSGLLSRKVNRSISYIFINLVFTAVGAQGQNSISRTTNYYNVMGATIRDIHESLAQARPWKNKSSMDGQTQWHVEWRFNVAPAGSICRCTFFTTTTTITVTLPRWTAPANAAAEVKTNWQRYITALGQHEAGHAQLALDAAAGLEKQNKTAESGDCDSLRRKINSQCNATIEEYRRREKDYDERTRHGVTQGAVLRFGPRGRERPRE